jgi:hypothetical protein
MICYFLLGAYYTYKYPEVFWFGQESRKKRNTGLWKKQAGTTHGTMRRVLVKLLLEYE